MSIYSPDKIVKAASLIVATAEGHEELPAHFNPTEPSGGNLWDAFYLGVEYGKSALAHDLDNILMGR